MPPSSSRRNAATLPPTHAAPTLPAAPRAILLVKTSSLGDVVHNLPVASDLRRHFPQAQIDWVVEETFADIPRLHPAVRRVIPVALRRWRKRLLQPATWGEIAAARRALRREAYDLVLDTQGLLKSAVLTSQTRLAPHGRRCGHAAESAREPIAARCYDTGYAIPKNVHAVERNRWLAAAACNYPPDLPLDYGLAALPASVPEAWHDGAAYAVLLTATSRDDKLWPEAHWHALIGALAAQGLQCILPAGSAGERSRAERLAATIPAGAARVAPPLSIAELAGLCAGAALVVGVDTGLTHLAAALARPTLALFCASNPQLTGVYTGDPPASPAINLGAAGQPPSAFAVIDAALAMLG
ncbi:Lipopolysaccharide heptosyltransferase 1 [Sterolibacterium denitrificans]|uniref:Lipopolysaccharide heptosyltransferase 1 n=1 Tax=Sterolibacterium denitrificans TaxID=157592 RepID=A0A7Z7HV81_9PROT|nr:lipopolysaccharide heptosyltransferase I [Sterolibacterium denitrificans]SMB32160.1 Lipopolysaccharide heptosyltransferase 1 [Sterolibacterium denitrificans]